MISKRWSFLPLLLATPLACSAGADSEVAETPTQAASLAKRPRFVDLSAALSADNDFERWYTLSTNLRRDFDAICGDTFCEGDYSNYQSLAIRCSVDTLRAQVHRCVWVFAASQQEVDSATGAIVVSARHWECPLPVAPRTRLKAFLDLSAAEQPLYAPLPGTPRSAYDALTECL